MARALKSLNYLFLCVLKLLQATISNINTDFPYRIFSIPGSSHSIHRNVATQSQEEIIIISSEEPARYSYGLKVEELQNSEEEVDWIRRPVYIA